MKVVVLGSGLGGLTTGAFLAKAGMHVTVIERHYRIGGYAHNFKRKNYTFESGVHTVPLSDDGVVRGIFKQLGINDKIETFKFPEMYRTINTYGTRVMPEDKDEARAYLYNEFPHEKEGLDIFFADLQGLHDNLFSLFQPGKKGFLDENHEFMEKFKHHSYASYLQGIIKDHDLYSLLCGQWPYVGITPEKGQHLFLQMLFATHYFNGSYGVKGGFDTIPKALASVITSNGGEIIMRDEVNRIITDGANHATAVTTTKGLTLEADLVISGISPYLLHRNLLPPESQNKRWKKRLDKLNPALSTVIVYLGLKPGYEKCIDSYVGMWFKYKDVEKPYDRIKNGDPYECDHMAILHGVDFIAGPTMTLFSFADINESNDWHRDKQEYANEMLNVIDEIYPGLRDYIGHIDIGSPDTFENYTLNTNGSIYGFENTCSRYGEAKMPYEYHMDNVYQTGHWTRPGCGVFNTITSGFTVAQLILDQQKS